MSYTTNALGQWLRTCYIYPLVRCFSTLHKSMGKKPEWYYH